MAKIHILEATYQGVSPNRTGLLKCLYHVNITANKNTSLNVASITEAGVERARVEIDGEPFEGGVIKGASMRLGFSNIGHLTDTSTHPDFGATVEDTLLSQQDIAEVELDIVFAETESQPTVVARVEGLYDNTETKANTLYTDMFDDYGSERNPA